MQIGTPITAFGSLDKRTPPLAGNMHVARSGHQATLLMDGPVLVTCGAADNEKAIAVTESSDPTTGAWSLAAANLTPRVGHATVLLHDGRVLVVGASPSVSSCEPIRSAERGLI